MSDITEAAEALLYVLDNDSSQGQLDTAKGTLAAALRGDAPVDPEPTPAPEEAAPVVVVPAPEPVAEVPATDAAVALADEHGVDLSTVEPSGASGQVIVADVKAAVADPPPASSDESNTPSTSTDEANV